MIIRARVTCTTMTLFFTAALATAACSGGSSSDGEDRPGAGGTDAPAVGTTPTGSGTGSGSGPGVEGPAGGIYTWKNITIVGGGFVSGIVFSPAQQDVIYARTDVGGAYRWDAAGKSWAPITDALGRADSNLTGIESIAADPRDAKRVYLAAGTYTQSWAGNGAILRSSDQGNTWQRTDMPIKMGGNEDGRSMGERLAVDPNQTSILYFGSRKDGLWNSTDAGAAWSKVSSFPATSDTQGIGITFVQFDPSSGSSGNPTPTIYVGVASSTSTLYRSTDSGATWQPVPGQPSGLLPSHAGLDKTGALYLSYGNGPGPNGVTSGAVWKYDTKANTWTNITPVAPGGGVEFGYGGLSIDPAHPGTVVVSTIDRWAVGDEIFRTTNGGASWTPIGPKAVRDAAGAKWLYWHGSSPSATGWMGDIDIDPQNPGRVLYVTGQGVWGSDDITAADANQATHWAFRSQGIEETVVLALKSPPSGAQLLSGVGDIAGFRHDDLSASPPDGMFSNPIFGNTDSLDFAESKPEIVARVGTNYSGKRGASSTDGGKTWTPFASEPAGSNGSGGIAVSTDGATFLWAPRDAAPAYSRDRGASWLPSSGLPSNLKPVADRVNAKKFYAFDGLKGEVYASADGGESFSVKAKGLPTLPDWALGNGSIQAVPGVEGDLWLTTGAAVYHSKDSGASFEPVALTQESYAMGFGKAAPGQSYAALYLIGKVNDVVGFFRSDDAAATWVRINDDQHQFGWTSHITGDPRIYGRVYVGTSGRGILYGDPTK
jgi:hypothetical protein